MMSDEARIRWPGSKRKTTLTRNPVKCKYFEFTSQGAFIEEDFCVPAQDAGNDYIYNHVILCILL